MQKTAIYAALLVVPALLAGCDFVPVKPAASDVLVLPKDRTASCKFLGKTDVSVADKIAFFNRFQSDVKSDLENLARNQAADSGGDTVTPLSDIDQGKQTFGIYKCLGTGSTAPSPNTQNSSDTVKTTPYQPPRSR